jgi:hypothetical protein
MTDIVDRLRDKYCCDDTCHCDEAAAEIERLRAALKELLWYTNQLELDVYDPKEWPVTHGAVEAARAALEAQPAAPGGDK